MPLLRGRRSDGGGTNYRMREKMFAVTVCIDQVARR